MKVSEYQQNLREAVQVLESLRELEEGVATAAAWCLEAFALGGKLLVCGNGGSAAEAQHLTGELVGRYKRNRAPLAAVTLSADASVMTCIGNDYSFEEAFARQVRALGRAGDVLVAFTTSGASPNVLRAMAAAKELGLKSVAFLGRDGGAAAKLADCALIVRHGDTARVQEGHQFLLHALMDAIEAGRNGPGDSE